MNHPVRLPDYGVMIQQSILFFCQCISEVPVWLFAACCQLLCLYKRKITDEMRQECSLLAYSHETIKVNYGQLLRSLDTWRQLQNAMKNLNKSFSWVLMIIWCHTLISFLTAAYYMVEFLHDGYFLAAYGEIITVTKSLIRLSLICFFLDQTRLSVSVIYLHEVYKNSNNFGTSR